MGGLPAKGALPAIGVLLAFGLLPVLEGCAPFRSGASARMEAPAVPAEAETAPVASGGDAADDPAIWPHPSAPDSSLVLGTDKSQAGGGLAAYDLSGRRVFSVADPGLNNVDTRSGFPLGGHPTDLVVAGRRTDQSIAVYAMRPDGKGMDNAESRPLVTGEIYGSCLYWSARTGRLFHFSVLKSGRVEQWELFDDGQGKVDARKVREMRIGSQGEGCVADDRNGLLWVGEEDKGLWVFEAEEEADPKGRLLDSIGPGRPLVADVEGVALAARMDGGGQVLVSVQGDDRFAAYDRLPPHRYLGSFRIGPGQDVDAVTGTDGIEVFSLPLGPRFPWGLFVAQDDVNPGGTQNYKFVRWEAISKALFKGKGLSAGP